MGQRGSKARYGVRHLGFIQADHIRISLNHDQIGDLSALLKIQAIEVISLVIERRIAGVDIFGLLLVVEYARPKPNHPAIRGNDREDYAPAIGVIGSPRIRVLHEQPRLHQLFR
ncbi:hypothetical protein SDC9_68539 [bioreactor metagenome]|uniref:Uncharacterized protein n=1 Tax=bioreactor metagenome TaxID=1076179 RepID=A0A644Y156_9ZZZZ